MKSKLSVLLGSDIPMLSHSLTDLLNSTSDLQVVASASSASKVLQQARACRADVAILDLDATPSELSEIVAELSGNGTRVLLISDALDDAALFGLFQTGLKGVISRKSTAELICKSVRSVADGQVWLSRLLLSKIVRRAQSVSHEKESNAIQETIDNLTAALASATNSVKPPAAENRLGLTPREIEVMQAITEGMSNKDIACQFGISPCTVKHHLTNIFDKVGVDSRLELGLFAIHHGWVASESLQAS